MDRVHRALCVLFLVRRDCARLPLERVDRRMACGVGGRRGGRSRLAPGVRDHVSLVGSLHPSPPRGQSAPGGGAAPPRRALLRNLPRRPGKDLARGGVPLGRGRAYAAVLGGRTTPGRKAGGLGLTCWPRAVQTLSRPWVGSAAGEERKAGRQSLPGVPGERGLPGLIPEQDDGASATESRLTSTRLRSGVARGAHKEAAKAISDGSQRSSNESRRSR